MDAADNADVETHEAILKDLDTLMHRDSRRFAGMATEALQPLQLKILCPGA